MPTIDSPIAETPEYVRAADVARRISVSVKKVYKMVKTGHLRAVKVGRAVCILAVSLDEYLSAHKVRLVEPAPAITRPQGSPSTRFQFLPRRP